MDLSRLNVCLGYKNFAARQGISHIGLGVSMANICKVLVSNGVNARVVPLARGAVDINRELQNDPSVTHFIVGAPWIPTQDFAYLTDQYNRTQFVMNCHSNVGFLQADAAGVQLLREAQQLEAAKYNFHVAGNSDTFCDAMIQGYAAPCTYLPNLYYLDQISSQSRPLWSSRGGPIRLGIFGATRWLKNFLTAVMSGIIVARSTGALVQLYINSARVDGPEVYRIMLAAQNMVAGLPNVSLNYVPWRAWPDFRTVVGTMDCLISPSYTESYNMVTADGASRQIPSAVSPAIDWAPDNWQCEVDDAPLLAKTVQGLLHDPQAGKNGLDALAAMNARGLNFWLNYLVRNQYGNGAQLWQAHGVPLHHLRPTSYAA